MGLAERRAAKEFETNRYPTLKKQIDDAAKTTVNVEVKWETMAADGYATSYDENWPKVYFTPLIEAFKSIARDDMGREALHASLKKVVIENRSGIYYGDRMASWADGVLTLDHEPCTNVDSIDERSDGIRKLLESKL